DQDTRTAMDRVMRGLKIQRSDGTALGSINWFGVHGTCVDNRNRAISSDNKGFASTLFEEAYPGTVSLSPQEKAGDVSPNYHGPDRKLMRTYRRSRRKDHGHGLARSNGALQAAQAMSLFEHDAKDTL